MKYKECWYCGALISNTGGQGDHFPVPKRHVGLNVIPCCLVCHDMKDRFVFDNWPLSWWEPIIKDFPKLSRETKIMIAKVISVGMDQIKEDIIKEKGNK